MAYALLAGVDPIVGIYTAFFPVIVYVFMGTSRHVSLGENNKNLNSISSGGSMKAITIITITFAIVLGTFAVISILISKIVQNNARIADHEESSSSHHKTYTEVQVVTAVTFMAGMFQVINSQDDYFSMRYPFLSSTTTYLYQILFGILRLGTFCSLLSHSLIRGFTTGAAMHVFSSQVKHLLGLKLPRFNGPFSLFKVVY